MINFLIHVYMVAAAVPARGWLKGMIYQSQSMFEAAAGYFFFSILFY